jgi:hypothetical protein
VYFSLIGGENVYDVSKVGAVTQIFPPGTTGNTTTDRWELVLTGNITEANNAAVAYTLHKDFTPKKGYPIFEPGDVQTAQILARWANMLDDIEVGVIKFHSKVITGADIDSNTIRMTFVGAPLGTIPVHIGTPIFEKNDPAEDNIPVLTIDSVDESGYNVNLAAGAVENQKLRNQYIE